MRTPRAAAQGPRPLRPRRRLAAPVASPAAPPACVRETKAGPPGPAALPTRGRPPALSPAREAWPRWGAQRRRDPAAGHSRKLHKGQGCGRQVGGPGPGHRGQPRCGRPRAEAGAVRGGGSAPPGAAGESGHPASGVSGCGGGGGTPRLPSRHVQARGGAGCRGGGRHPLSPPRPPFLVMHFLRPRIPFVLKFAEIRPPSSGGRRGGGAPGAGWAGGQRRGAQRPRPGAALGRAG